MDDMLPRARAMDGGLSFQRGGGSTQTFASESVVHCGGASLAGFRRHISPLGQSSWLRQGISQRHMSSAVIVARRPLSQEFIVPHMLCSLPAFGLIQADTTTANDAIAEIRMSQRFVRDCLIVPDGITPRGERAPLRACRREAG